MNTMKQFSIDITVAMNLTGHYPTELMVLLAPAADDSKEPFSSC